MARDERWDDDEVSLVERELELELEAGEDTYGAASELDDELESDDGATQLEEGEQRGYELDDRDDYAQRLHELSLREFESEDELEHELREIIDDMEREYFLGSVGRALKKGARSVGKVATAGAKLAGGGLVQNAAKFAGQALKGGGLMPLARAALSTFASSTPWGAALMPALSALGFSAGGGAEQSQPAWGAFADLAKNAFGRLASNLQSASASELSDPVRTAQLANAALDGALQSARRAGRSRGERRVRRIRLRPGERLIIEAE